MTEYEIIDGRRCRDVTTEALRKFGDWLLDDTIRDAVKVMIEGGRSFGTSQASITRRQNLGQVGSGHALRVKAGNAGQDWNTIEDFDADLPRVKAYKIEREAKDKLCQLSGKAKGNPSTLHEVHYEKKQQRLF